jgi:hypothetical protein
VSQEIRTLAARVEEFSDGCPSTSLIVFEGKSGNVFLIPAIEDLDHFGAEAARGAGGVNRSVASADNDDAAAHGEIAARFVALDEIERADDGGVFFAGNAELVHRTEANAYKNKVVFVFELGEFPCGDFLAEAEVDTELADHFNFAEAVSGTEFVFGHAVGIQATG